MLTDWWDNNGEASVWAINEWDPNTYEPPGDVTWLRDRTSTEGRAQWSDPVSGRSIIWAGEDGTGSGQLALAA